MSYYKLASRSFLRLSGPDAERFLNGQVTQNVSLTKGRETLWTAVTDAKGRLEGVGCVRGLENGDFLFDCPEEIGDEMEARLDRYLIADDCEWFREDGQWSIIVGEGMEEGGASNRFRKTLKEQIIKGEAKDVPELSEELENSWRVRHAVPAWGREILPGMLPAECGLYDLALSFDKGCYIGQEIISRMETSGKKRTRLYQVLSKPELDLKEFSTSSCNSESKGGLVVSKHPPELISDGITINEF